MHVLHDEEDDGAGLAHPVDRDDMRMFQRGRQTCLPLETLDELCVERASQGQHLDRHIPFERSLAGPVYDGHPPAAQLLQYFVVVAECRTNHLDLFGRVGYGHRDERLGGEDHRAVRTGRTRRCEGGATLGTGGGRLIVGIVSHEGHTNGERSRQQRLGFSP